MKKHKTKRKESLTVKLLNSISILLMAGLMFLGLRVYSASNNNLTFAQISDVHFSTNPVNTSYRLTAESGALLADAIDQINTTPNINFVMFTGDQINTPYEKQLMAFLPYANQPVRFPPFYQRHLSS